MCTLLFLHSNNLPWITVIVCRENKSTMVKRGWEIFLPYSSCRIKTSTIRFFFFFTSTWESISKAKTTGLSFQQETGNPKLLWDLTLLLHRHLYPRATAKFHTAVYCYSEGTITKTLALNHLDVEIPVQKTLCQNSSRLLFWATLPSDLL